MQPTETVLQAVFPWNEGGTCGVKVVLKSPVISSFTYQAAMKLH